MYAECQKNLAQARLKIRVDLVLPNPNYPPVHSAKCSEVLLIPQAVLGDLALPKPLQFVLPRWEPKPMPKISIYKDSDFCLWKHDVGLAG